MTYITYFVSEDYPTGDTWSVYTELYENREAHEPIDGSEKRVLHGLPTEQVANAAAEALYRQARLGGKA